MNILIAFFLTAAPGPAAAAQPCSKTEACAASAAPSSPFLEAARAASPAKAVPAAKKTAAPAAPAAAAASASAAASPALPEAPVSRPLSSPAWVLFAGAGLAGLYLYLRERPRGKERK